MCGKPLTGPPQVAQASTCRRLMWIYSGELVGDQESIQEERSALVQWILDGTSRMTQDIMGVTLTERSSSRKESWW